MRENSLKVTRGGSDCCQEYFVHKMVIKHWAAAQESGGVLATGGI